MSLTVRWQGNVLHDGFVRVQALLQGQGEVDEDVNGAEEAETPVPVFGAEKGKVSRQEDCDQGQDPGQVPCRPVRPVEEPAALGVWRGSESGHQGLEKAENEGEEAEERVRVHPEALREERRRPAIRADDDEPDQGEQDGEADEELVKAEPDGRTEELPLAEKEEG